MKDFAYVNGSLFKEKTSVPKFTKRALRLFKECGELDWKSINPDIFGSMIQAVAQPGLREDLGMHYTSVPNIMKVLHPLFLISLEEEFEASRDSEVKLNKLLQRLYSIRLFDPACGSGNFLIIAYKELRKIEMRIFQRQREIAKQWSLAMTGIRLTQLSGIELNDFAAETAKLSLWIAEYQMNEQFKEVFGEAPPALPLRDNGNIIHDNAAKRDWTEICAAGGEIYLVGNPPYLGRAEQSVEQKDDMEIVFSKTKAKYKNLDYVACWMFKAASYCEANNASFAFVTTNSICQGEQVALLWPLVLRNNLEIGFAHQSFKWRNNASSNAAVTCVVVGVRPKSKAIKRLFAGEHSREAKNINPYLIEFDDLIVTKRSSSISGLPQMDFGSMPNDGGYLLMTTDEKDSIIHDYPEATKFIRRFYGSKEFLQGKERWCLWIEDRDLSKAIRLPPLKSRIDALQKHRLLSDRIETKALASSSHKFGEVRHQNTEAIIVPRHFSEDRNYVAIGMIDGNTEIIGDAACAVFNAPGYLFAIMSSRLHLIWTAAVGGRIKSDYRYSNTLVYNTFPVPQLSQTQKDMLEDHTVRILGVREQYPGKTIAWLYDPETMPTDLAVAHFELDEALEGIYIGHLFKNDTQRLEHLFKLYANMLSKQSGMKRKRTT